jgi:hypothetical protein
MVTRRRWWYAAAALLAAPLLGGCELDAVNVQPPRPQVVVHAVLNADASEQVILVESSLTGRVAIDSTVRFDPLDPIRSAGGEPLTGADVRLLSDGDSAGVAATETRVSGRGTGRYAIAATALAIRPGARYRLRVRTTDGREVTGETLVPGAPPGWMPGSGTQPTAVSFARDRDTLALSWTPVAGARTYAVRVETPFGPWALFSDSTRFALSGTLRNFLADGLPSVWLPGFRQVVNVVAVDRNFYDYNRSGNDPFGGTGLISSVRGGLGLFGSMVGLLRREVTVTERDRAPLDAAWRGTTAEGQVVTFDLWIDVAGPTVASVSGRRQAPEQFVIGTLRDGNLRLAVLATRSSADTAALFSGRLQGDSLVGEWDGRFETRLPRVLRRSPRTAATVTP